MTATATDRRAALVICGLGGQGVLFLTRLIGEAAIAAGLEVRTSETHGMAQRGGAVYSHLKIGRFASPLVRLGTADAAIALDPSRRTAAEMFLARGGRLFVSGPSSPNDPAVVDAVSAATSLGHPRGANLVLLGFACRRAPELFPGDEAIFAALRTMSSPDAFERNRQAFLKGAALA